MDAITNVYVFVCLLFVVHMVGWLIPRYVTRPRGRNYHSRGQCCQAFLLSLFMAMSSGLTLVFLLADYVNRHFTLDNPHAPLYFGYLGFLVLTLLGTMFIQLTEMLLVWGAGYITAASSSFVYLPHTTLLGGAAVYLLCSALNGAMAFSCVTFSVTTSYWVVMAGQWLTDHDSSTNDPHQMNALRDPASWQIAVVGVLAALRIAVVFALELKVLLPWYEESSWDRLKDQPHPHASHPGTQGGYEPLDSSGLGMGMVEVGTEALPAAAALSAPDKQ